MTYAILVGIWLALCASWCWGYVVGRGTWEIKNMEET